MFRGLRTRVTSNTVVLFDSNALKNFFFSPLPLTIFRCGGVPCVLKKIRNLFPFIFPSISLFYIVLKMKREPSINRTITNQRHNQPSSLYNIVLLSMFCYNGIIFNQFLSISFFHKI